MGIVWPARIADGAIRMTSSCVCGRDISCTACVWKVAPLAGGDRIVVDAGVAATHKAIGRELPMLVAVAAVPLAAGVVPLALEPHRDAVARVAPQLLLQPVVELDRPLALQKVDDRCSTGKELGTVAP